MSYHLGQLNDDEVAETEDPPDIVETSITSSEGFWTANDPADPSDGDASQKAHKNISHKSSLSLQECQAGPSQPWCGQERKFCFSPKAEGTMSGQPCGNWML